MKLSRLSVITTLIYLLSLIYLCWFVDRSQFVLLSSCYVIMTCCMIYLVQDKRDDSFTFYTGILLRIVAFISFPTLSDDIYRFIWDGQLMVKGINPYEQTPAQFNAAEHLSGSEKFASGELYEQLNSADYYTVYPPLIQAINAIAALLGNGHIYFTTIILKLFTLGADLLLLAIFFRLLKSHSWLSSNFFALYALNPLLILEISGNGHHESILSLFLVLSILMLFKGKFLAAGLSLGVAVSIKFYPIILLPVILAYATSNKKRLLLAGGSLISMAVLLFPLMNAVIMNSIMSSVKLYFQTFIFNSPVYLAMDLLGNDILPPGLELTSLMPYMTVGVIIFITLKVGQQKMDLVHGLIIVLSAYLIFSRVIHPWYIIPITGLAVMISHTPSIWWLTLSFVSYSAYATIPYKENYLLISISFLVLIAFTILYYRRRMDQEIASFRN